MTGIAAMTAFYMFRLYYCIFWNGEWKGHSHESGPDAHTPHEAPLTMTFPLMFFSRYHLYCRIHTFRQSDQ